MCEKVKLYYFNGRGKMESIRWLLAAVGVEFEEVFLETREQYEALSDKALPFCQVPMAEIDGMKLVYNKAILQYIAGKHNLYGKDLKERALRVHVINTGVRVVPISQIEIYAEGTNGLMEIIMSYPFLPPEEKETHIDVIVEKAKKEYFPFYEKVLRDHGENFLVGNQFSLADVQLLEAILMVEEHSPDVLSDFPKLQDFKERISDIPTIKSFLQPGSQRKPPPDDKYVESVKSVMHMYNKIAFN